MSKAIEFDKWFNPKLQPIECGIELELLLFDARNKEPLNNQSLVERILNNLPSQVYRDFYPYQLELRTKPHSDPKGIVDETRELYQIASKEFLKHRIYVIPAPSIVREGYTHCGLHAHISYPEDRNKEIYYKKAMGMYPFILALADHSKNFEIGDIHTSDRMEKSQHIGLPELVADRFMDIHRDRRKYKDLIYSPCITEDGNRSRMKKPATIEIRLLDTPSLFNFFEFIIYYITNIAGRIKTDNPMVKLLNEDFQESSNRLSMTRNLLINQRYGVNKIFRMLNSDICDEVSTYCGIKFPRETQFEYRERLGLSANVNGYLSMTTKGGWL